MGRYFAIITDSYHEAVDSKILTTLLFGSTFFILVVLCTGWWKTEQYDLQLGATKAGSARLGLTVREGKDGLELAGRDSSGPASHIEVGPGYVLADFAGESLTTKKALREALSKHKAGDTIKVTIRKPWLTFLHWEADPNFPMGQSMPTHLKFYIIQYYVFVKWIVGFLGVIIGLVVTAWLLPKFLETGTIHLVMSRPVSRWGVIWAKFFGGLSFMVLFSAYLIGGVFLAMSLRSGIWSPRTLYAIPILIFTFAQFYAFSCLCSVMSKSQIFTVIAAVLFYFFALAFNFTNDRIQSFLTTVSPNAVSITPDGRRVSVSVRDGMMSSIVKQFVVTTKEEAGEYVNVSRSVGTNFQSLQGGQTIVSVLGASKLVELDQFSRAPVRVAEFGNGRILLFAVSPDRRAVVLVRDNDLAVFSMEDFSRNTWPTVQAHFGRFGTVTASDEDSVVSALAFDGDYVALGYRNGVVKLREARAGKLVKRWKEAHSKAVRALAFVGPKLMSAGEEGLVKLWESSKDEALHKLKVGPSIIGGVSAEGGDMLGVWEESGAMHILEGTDKVVEKRHTFASMGAKVTCANFSGGRYFVAGSNHSLCGIWNVEDGSKIDELDLAPTARTISFYSGIVYWCLPRTTELDSISSSLLLGDDNKEMLEEGRGEIPVRELNYWTPLLSGCLFIIVMVTMTAGVFATRDL